MRKLVHSPTPILMYAFSQIHLMLCAGLTGDILGLSQVAQLHPKN